MRLNHGVPLNFTIQSAYYFEEQNWTLLKKEQSDKEYIHFSVKKKKKKNRNVRLNTDPYMAEEENKISCFHSRPSLVFFT